MAALEIDDCEQARIIPVSGINGQDEQERRVASASLAVVAAVRDFGHAIVRPLGAPAGTIETFIEVPLTVDDDTNVRVDGVIRVSRGQRSWTCLVEVKTGSARLDRDQINCYLDAAKVHGADALLTISNELAPAAGVHPVDADRRKLRTVKLFHLAWTEILGLAIEHRQHRGVADPEQAWILAELIRYLEHPKSGVLQFHDMGPSWVEIRKATIEGTLRISDKGLVDVTTRWDQLLRYIALHLDRDLGAGTSVVLSRKDVATPAARLAGHAEDLATQGVLRGSLKVPQSVANVGVLADVRSGRVFVSTELDAPSEGRPLTRVNWLLRQLNDCTGDLRIDTQVMGRRGTTSELLSTVRADPSCLLPGPKSEPRRFVIVSSARMGPKRGRGQNCFIDSVIAAVESHYRDVHQRLRRWTPRAPQLPREEPAESERIDLTATPDPSRQPSGGA